MSCSREWDLQSHSPGEVLCVTVVATLIRMHAPVYAGLGRRLGRLPNLLEEMREHVVFWTASTDQVASRNTGSTDTHTPNMLIEEALVCGSFVFVSKSTNNNKVQFKKFDVLTKH
jgi:hypothetical protein